MSNTTERFWELYNKYKDNIQEVLELAALMQEMAPEKEAKNED